MLVWKRKLFSPKAFVWFEHYQSWEGAERAATGYDTNQILEKCKSALIKVRDGLAVYERDSVLFDEIQYSWGLLAGLQKAAIENNGELCVLDFGGSLGSSYYQNKDFLNGLKKITWCIVEQANFVAAGKENFENKRLKFYYTIEDCLAENSPNVLLLSSVLQYLPNPNSWIKKFLAYNFPYIILDRTAFVAGDQNLVCLQNVPPYIYKASYPCWFFERKGLLKQFEKSYQVLCAFDSGFTPPLVIEGNKIYWDGFILKR